MGSRYPFPSVPEGWFAVAASNELDESRPLAVEALGGHLVVFRDDAGAARVLDAHCPHLGAHLGVGGRVEDGCVRCPFHGWVFDGDGRCVAIPYSRRIPTRARIRSHPVMEWAGLVLVYHAPAGAGDLPPRWTPDFPDLDGWVEAGQREWRARVHVQDIGENGLDVAHVADVHGAPVPELVTAEGRGPTFRIVTRPTPGSPTAAYLDGIDRTLWGLGLSLNEFRGAVNARVVIARTPIDDDHTHIRAVFFPEEVGTAEETRAIGEMLTARIGDELEQDIPIWEHKAYVERPILVSGDGPVMAWRTWASQFYE